MTLKAWSDTSTVAAFFLTLVTHREKRTSKLWTGTTIDYHVCLKHGGRFTRKQTEKNFTKVSNTQNETKNGCFISKIQPGLTTEDLQGFNGKASDLKWCANNLLLMKKLIRENEEGERTGRAEVFGQHLHMRRCTSICRHV